MVRPPDQHLTVDGGDHPAAPEPRPGTCSAAASAVPGSLAVRGAVVRLTLISASANEPPPAWQIATASASAACSDAGGSGSPSSVPTMRPTCRLPAEPLP